MDKKPLIFIVEDEIAIQELYQCALEDSGFDLVICDGEAQMQEALKTQSPDLFILDIMLEGKSGIDILQDLREKISRYADTPIIMVSAKNDEMSKVKALNLDADDYMSKPFGIMELIARIKSQLRKAQSKQKKQSYKSIVINEPKHEITVLGNVLTLTRKEYNLLKLFVSYAEEVIERGVLLEKVWGEDYFGETRTLDIHVSEVRKKIKAQDETLDIKTVRGVGYSLV